MAGELSIVDTDDACFVRGSYNEKERLGTTLITTFERNGVWQRKDVELIARCHAPESVLLALTEAGFGNCVCIYSDEDQDLRRDLGPGRACFLAAKQ